MSEVTDYIYEAKKARDTLKRLKNNDDYKFIIEDGYFGKYKEGALKALAYTASKEQQDFIISKVQGIAYLKSFLLNIEREGEKADYTEAHMDELTTEEGNA